MRHVEIASSDHARLARTESCASSYQYFAVNAAPERPLSRADVESRFIALLDGSQSRDEVDRWASQIMIDLDDAAVEDEVWWALGILSGIDLRHGPDKSYLHDDEQVRGWLTEFRARTG